MSFHPTLTICRVPPLRRARFPLSHCKCPLPLGSGQSLSIISDPYFSFYGSKCVSRLPFSTPLRFFFRSPRSPSMVLGGAYYPFTFCATNFQSYLATPSKGIRQVSAFLLFWLSYAVRSPTAATSNMQLTVMVPTAPLLGTHLTYRVQYLSTLSALLSADAYNCDPMVTAI